ncbi:MAG: rod shape-determining protein MreC [SAR324 cluster bacterium]|jgi:rod shape-determining protein MreC|nr:rod shape-determining protein MreC [SAR324 cluster bacterium]|tara:strand:- start:7499 stop:8335 length:837 start_codon:yes stop_codon:yes gene_type:complete
MFKFISTYRLQISILVAILGLFVLLFQSHNEQGSSRIQIAIQTVTYPFQASVQSAVSNIKNLWNSYIFLIDVKEENNRLKQQILDMEEKLSEHIENSVQFRRLRDQMLFARKNPLEKIYAEIIGESSDNAHNIRFINRGSNQKVQRNYIVIRKEGLVGRIHSVSPFQSSVQLMIDHRNRVPALIQRNRVRGLIYGTQAGIEMRQINQHAKIKIGDRVISSGLGGLYHKGILIGWVSEIRHQQHELFKTAILESAVDFNSIEEVFVIIPSKSDSEAAVE